MDSNTPIFLNIPKHAVLRKDISMIDNAITLLTKCGTRARDRLAIVFDGWNNTPEDIWEIVEIRRWTRKVFEKYPHIFYFLSKELDGVKNFAVCLADVEALRPQKRYTVDELIDMHPEELPQTRLKVRLSPEDSLTIFNAVIKYASQIHEDVIDLGLHNRYKTYSQSMIPARGFFFLPRPALPLRTRYAPYPTCPYPYIIEAKHTCFQLYPAPYIQRAPSRTISSNWYNISQKISYRYREAPRPC